MSCTICGKATGPGALLCRPCKAALKRARQFTVLEIPGTAPTITMPSGLLTPARAPLPPPRKVRDPVPWHALTLMTTAVLAATAIAFVAIRHWPRNDGIASATTAPRPVPAPANVVREPVVNAADVAPLPIAPRTLTTHKPRARASAAEAPVELPTPAPQPATIAAATAVEVQPSPAPTVAVAAPDRWQVMSDALARCAREGGLSGFICHQRARLDACEGYWGRVPQCPLPENPR